MKLFTEVFNCRYPIIAMAMNQVSDLNLACAIRQAGALPSLSTFNYIKSFDHHTQTAVWSVDELKKDIEAYCAVFGDGSILISTESTRLLEPEFLSILIDFKIKAVEIIRPDRLISEEDNQRVNDKIIQLRKNNTLVFFKILKNVGNVPKSFADTYDGFILKGSEGAGRGDIEKTPLIDLYKQSRINFADKYLILSGGIGTSEQVRDYMQFPGVLAIGIGTLFAACQESKISEATKLKMIESTSADLSRIPSNKFTDQSALVFSKDVTEVGINNTYGLKEGIKDPTRGHVFAGKGIDQITEILPANTIVQNLVKDL
jgi:NAD(P)H-dependent flavin oxidoreductase YrpB (nitropropane dioxygenase family)